MKHERNHHGTVDKSFSEQQIRIVDANYILCEKNWTHNRVLQQAGGRQIADKIEVNLEVLKITVHRKIWFFVSFNEGTAVEMHSRCYFG